MKFSIAGTGNVAWHFAKMLRANGHQLLQVYARSAEKASEFKAEVIQDASLFSKDNDIVIIAVKDDAIAEVASHIAKSIFTIHTSGGTDINVLPQNRSGVVWPVQSIKKDKELDYIKLPFVTEASDESGKSFLLDVFGSISQHIYFSDSNQRAHAHMAIVFANNFVNQMYGIAEEILKENNLPIDIMLPGIREHAEKMTSVSPADAQTGPALRADIKTINRHLDFLKDKKELHEIYSLMTNRILEHYHGKKL